MSSIATFTLVIAAFLLVISLVQPAAERLHLPYTVLLAIVGVAVGGLCSFLLDTTLTNLFDDIVRPIVELPLGYGRALELSAADFEQFLEKYPRARAEIEGTAAARARTGGTKVDA